MDDMVQVMKNKETMTIDGYCLTSKNARGCLADVTAPISPDYRPGVLGVLRIADMALESLLAIDSIDSVAVDNTTVIANQLGKYA